MAQGLKGGIVQVSIERVGKKKLFYGEVNNKIRRNIIFLVFLLRVNENEKHRKGEQNQCLTFKNHLKH